MGVTLDLVDGLLEEERLVQDAGEHVVNCGEVGDVVLVQVNHQGEVVAEEPRDADELVLQLVDLLRDLLLRLHDGS